jgi:hypothetical protein
MSGESKSKRKGIRILVAGVALSALGLGTWWFLNRSKANNSGFKLAQDEPEDQQPASSPGKQKSPAPTVKPPASDFPLIKGSKNERVKQLQLILINRFGKELLPKYGADGYFGTELLTALQSKNIPVPVTEAAFTTLTSVDPKIIVDGLIRGLNANNFALTYTYLKMIRNTAEYKKAGDLFRSRRYNGVETSIPTALFRKFTIAYQKEMFDTLLTGQIGLKKEGEKYVFPSSSTVSGFLHDRRIITARPTRVWARAKHPLSVGINTILGREISSTNGITEFETADGYRLFVVTGHVRFL